MKVREGWYRGNTTPFQVFLSAQVHPLFASQTWTETLHVGLRVPVHYHNITKYSCHCKIPSSLGWDTTLTPLLFVGQNNNCHAAPFLIQHLRFVSARPRYSETDIDIRENRRGKIMVWLRDIWRRPCFGRVETPRLRFFSCPQCFMRYLFCSGKGGKRDKRLM